MNNSEVSGKIQSPNVQPVYQALNQSRLMWLGCVLVMSTERLPNSLYGDLRDK